MFKQILVGKTSKSVVQKGWMRTFVLIKTAMKADLKGGTRRNQPARPVDGCVHVEVFFYVVTAPRCKLAISKEIFESQRGHPVTYFV